MSLKQWVVESRTELETEPLVGSEYELAGAVS